MPANKISYNSDIHKAPNTVYDGNTVFGFEITAPDKPVYLSQHSNAEYETLRKAFLLLGERYDKLLSDYEEALGDIDDMIEQQIVEEEYRDWQGD